MCSDLNDLCYCIHKHIVLMSLVNDLVECFYEDIFHRANSDLDA